MPHWRLILRRAWSIRLMLLAGALSAAEVVLPFIEHVIPRGVFAGLSALAVGSAFVARLEKPNYRSITLSNGLPNGPEKRAAAKPVCCYSPRTRPPPMPELAYRYQRLTWSEIDLDFAGTKPAAHAIHRRIAELSVGSPLILRQAPGGNWLLCDEQETVIGKLSQRFQHPHAAHCIKARVLAIHLRRRQEVAKEYQAGISPTCEAWEMLIPELVFAPDKEPSPGKDGLQHPS